MDAKQGNPSAGKNWYLYVVDQHEGPFTSEEIIEKIRIGEARTSSYVWREGLSDWVFIHSIPEFSNEKTNSAPPTSRSTQSSSSAADLLGFNRTVASGRSKSKKSKSTSYSGRQSTSISFGGFIFILFLLLAFYQSLATNKLDMLLDTFKLKKQVASLALPPIPTREATSLIKPYYLKFAKLVAPRLPVQYRKYLLPIEIPNGVPEKDADALYEAALHPIENGPRVASVLSMGTEKNPKFVLAGNVPDGLRLDIILRGKKGTLLNEFQFEAESNAVFKNKTAFSTALQTIAGHPLPLGEYTVLIYDSDHQTPEISLELASMPRRPTPSIIPQNKTVFLVQSLFLGGERTTQYEQALKEFNQRIQGQFVAEINELKQMQATVESMANESAIKFFQLSAKIKDKRSVKEWSNYNAAYSRMSAQIRKQLQLANPSQPPRLFPELYSLAARTFQLSEVLHGMEDKYFSNPTTMADIQAMASETLQALTQMKTEIETRASQQ